MYFTSNFTDNIHVFDPMTYSDTDAQLTIIAAAGAHNNVTPLNLSGSSYTGITVDKVTGAVYAAGPSRNPTIATNDSVITRVHYNGTNWVITNLSRQDGNALSGVQSLGENQLVLSNAKTGGLHFFEFNGTTLVDKGTAAGSNALWSPSLAVDTANKKIYQGRSDRAIPSKSGGVDVFSYSYNSGTQTFSGTRIGELIAAVSGTETVANTQPYQYQNVALNDNGTLLAIPVNRGKTDTTDLNLNNFLVYDISGPTPTLLATLNGGSDSDPLGSAHRANSRGYGVTFFKQGGKEYLLTFYSNQADTTTVSPYPAGMSRGYVYQVNPTSNITTWEMY